jgi:cell wall-associated NlpC family hydrolase
MATRASIVAATAAAAAAFAVLPTQPPAPAAPTVPGPTAPAPAPIASAPITLLNATSPAANRSSAMRNALSKVGAPYRYGSAGPNAFDCSGLVSWAFKNAGTSLPRSSRAMSTVGKAVSKSDLQPGDLVFFYKPVSHVGIYIGDGKMVHARTFGQPVAVTSVDQRGYRFAKRVA